MRIHVVLFFLFFFTFLLPVAAQSNGKRILQPNAMQEDFRYLRKMLEDTHPGLYMHHTREAMQYKMDSLYAQLDQPLTLLDFYKKVAYLVAEVRCEHTYCNYGKGLGEFLKKAKLFPLQLYFLSGKAYVVVNCSDDRSIELGDEVVTINDYPIDSIKKGLYQYLPADGYMLSAKEQELAGMKFNIWYALFIEQPDEYRATIRKSSGELITKKWHKDLTLQKLNQLALKNPVNKKILEIDRTNKLLVKQPLQLEWLPQQNAAVMTVRSFSTGKQPFDSTISHYFDSLATQGTRTLIINISNNGGGDEDIAAELFSYFIKQPSHFIEREYLITDNDSLLALSNIPDDVRLNKYDYIDPLKNGKSEVKITKYSQELKIVMPKPHRFAGRVYLYVNGKTSSAASTFAAVMKSNGLATIVGDETAGSYSGGGTTIGLDLTLPQSGITAHTSIVYMAFATKGGDGNRGVLPDHPYLPSFVELIDGQNKWKDYILGLENGK